MKQSTSIFALGLSLVFLGCQSAEAPDETPVDEGSGLNQLTEAEAADGWQLLFDGDSMGQWRGFQQEDMPPGWQIVDGAMTQTAPAHGEDLVTQEQYTSFELAIDWMVPENGNSGIMFHVTEDLGTPWATGPEYQVYDNAAGGAAKNSAGSNYDVHAPTEDVARPFGEWNEARLIVDGAHVEHWLNGLKIVEYELWTEDWDEAVANSKWVNYEDYGQRETGHIALQGDHTGVSYRNIKIRTL